MTDFVSVNGLGGGGELGLVQAGLTLKHRTGSLDLGAPVVRGNRQLMGWDWDDEFSKNYEDWERFSPRIIYGNPPCSGFSTLTAQKHRGVDAAINKCIWELVNYAGAQKTPPDIVAFESVQQAFTTGYTMMKDLRAKLEADTGVQYHLTHLLQSNASLGGVSVRKRYFWVASRIPFGVEYAQPRRVARLEDALNDLQGLGLTAALQPYRRPPTWWSINRRAADGVDGHFNPKRENDRFREMMEAMESIGQPWRPGEGTDKQLQKYYAATGRLPGFWDQNREKLLKKNLKLGLNQTFMWDPERQGYVVTGAGVMHSVHWAEKRLYTQREVARIQGFPDTWRIWPARDYKKLGLVWGKGVPVDAGRWLGTWMKAALDGTPGTVLGEPIGERETKVNITNGYKDTLEFERRWEHSKYTLSAHEEVDAEELAPEEA